MKSSKNLSQNTLSSRFNKILITTVAFSTLLTTFTSCTADEIPNKVIVIQNSELDIVPVINPNIPKPPVVKK